MPKKAALISIHGMGRTLRNFDDHLLIELEERLGDKFASLHIGKVYYQGLMQPNEDRYWKAANRHLKWEDLRKFLLFGFADAAGLENGKESPDSVYSQTQQLIAQALWKARAAMDGDGPVVILAQSLGGQVMSCYFWDAQKAAAGTAVKVGIWQDIQRFAHAIGGGDALSADELAFLQGRSLNTLFTTGCNIPLFVAAHDPQDIVAIRPNPQFKWHNFYDKDDVLGWPLAELSDSYQSVVTDHRINAGDGITGLILKSWNPLAHNEYWGDTDVLEPLTEALDALL
ncbi:hypothetical protein [Parachitinimonas caeni]|uniref:Alpha/beta hydrolase n=1 Tax=Parachitinimonas caeni TaxID=3031301 RepID=A0ABT7E1E1_9NEIS|nr:hypothetical protein [Parachitinimonas caeni]MDK2126139.1 hypothetical protein [Parachitinimonas caeni]